MSLLSKLRGKKDSASLARERLQLVVAHRRHSDNRPDYFPQMQRDLLAVLRKYVKVDDDAIQMDVERGEELDVLELNITLPDERQ